MMLEDLIEELGNSRNKVVPELLNAYPVLAVHGVESPFRKTWANKLAGAFIPLGLLLFVRSVLFDVGVRKSVRKIIKVSGSLIDYFEKGIIKDIN